MGIGGSEPWTDEERMAYGQSLPGKLEKALNGMSEDELISLSNRVLLNKRGDGEADRIWGELKTIPGVGLSDLMNSIQYCINRIQKGK